MANSELIDEVINRPAVQAQFDFLLSQLDALKKAYAEINNSSITLKGASSTKDLANGLNDVAAASKNATKAQDDLSKARINAEKLAQQQLKTEQQVIKVIKEEEKANQEILRTQKQRLAEAERQEKITAKEAKTIADASNEYLQLGRQLREAEAAYKQLYLTQGKDDAQTQAALKNALSIRKVLDEVDQSLGNYQRNVGNYASGFNGLNVSIQQILREAPSAAVSLNTFFLAISNNLPSFFDEIAKIKTQQEAANLATKEAAVLAKEQAIATALSTGVTKEAALAEGLLAEQTVIANAAQTAAPSILKRIVSSLFSLQSMLTVGVLLLTLFGSAAIAAVGSIFKFGDKLDDNKKSLDNSNKSLKDLQLTTEEMKLSQEQLNKALEGSEYTKAIVQVNDLSNNIRLAKDGLIDKTEVLKLYNDTIGKTTGEVTTLDEAERALGQNADAYIKMTLYKAAAQLALEEAAKKSLEAEKIRLKNEKEFASTLADTRIAQQGTFNAKEYDAETKRIETAQKKRKQDAIDIEENAAQQQENIALDFQKRAANIASGYGFDIFGGKEDEKKKKVKDVKDIADAVAELRKELAAIQGKVDLGELAPTEADIDRVKAYDKAFGDIFKRGGTAGTPIVQTLAVELNPISLRVMEQQIKDFAQANSSKIDLLPPKAALESRVKEYTASFAEGEAKMYDEIIARQLVVLQTQEANEKAALEKRFAAGLISRTEYENGLLNITEKYGRLQLEEQYKFLLEEAKLLPSGTKGREDAEKKLAELRILLNKKVLTEEQKAFQQSAAALESYLGKVKEGLGVVTDLIGGALNAQTIAEKNKIQETENSQQSQFESEVARINATTATEEQKHNQIALLEATRKAQKEKNDRDQRQADMARARFDKATTIAKITLDTALAVVHELATGDPVTKFARAFVVGAIGAAQLATAIATPLPKFFRGKDASNKYEGPGIVGDGGRSEVIARESGAIEVTPNRSTVTYLKRNDIVYPSIEAYRNKVAMSKTDKVLSNGMLVQQVPVLDTKKLENEIRGVVHAIHNKPSNETVWTERGVITRVKNGFSETEYINRYVKGM